MVTVQYHLTCLIASIQESAIGSLPKHCLDVVSLQRIAGGTLQIRDRFVDFRLCTELIAACGRKCRLTFEHLVDVGLTGVKFPLLGFVLLGGVLARYGRRSQTGFGRAKRLQGIADVDLDGLFDLFPLYLQPLAFYQRSPSLGLRRLVTENR